MLRLFGELAHSHALAWVALHTVDFAAALGVIWLSEPRSTFQRFWRENSKKL
jgi:hypothetical protein